MVKLHLNLKLGIKFRDILFTKRSFTNMEQVYKTKQREQVLDFLKHNSDKCLSADEIIDGLSTDEKKASKATVYRCLEIFTGDGTVSKFIGAKGDSALYRYNGGHSDHFHLKCTNCSRTECVECGFIGRMQSHFFEHHGFTVSRTQTVFYGLCRACSRIGSAAK